MSQNICESAATPWLLGVLVLRGPDSLGISGIFFVNSNHMSKYIPVLFVKSPVKLVKSLPCINALTAREIPISPSEIPMFSPVNATPIHQPRSRLVQGCAFFVALSAARRASLAPSMRRRFSPSCKLCRKRCVFEGKYPPGNQTWPWKIHYKWKFQWKNNP